jgi:hypothetical protein
MMQRSGIDPAIIGDLIEEYSKGHSVIWFWVQTFGALLTKAPGAARYVVAFRWLAALPLAILAVRLVSRSADFVYFGVFHGDFPHMMYLMYPLSFLVAATFVSTMVIVVPDRKHSVARIAFGVVLISSASPLALSVLSGNKSWTFQILVGLCGLLGGAAAYGLHRNPEPRTRNPEPQPIR